MRAPSFPRRLARWLAVYLLPNQRIRLTPEGRGYLMIWALLLVLGLYLQSNLVLLIAGLAAGPLVASVILSASALRRLDIQRRVPPYAFAGGAIELEYVLINHRRWLAALATRIEDTLEPAERVVPGAARLTPLVFFARVKAQATGRVRWRGTAPARGRYRLGELELITRAPFGLLERRLSFDLPADVIVYPRMGRLRRRWHQVHKEMSEARRGVRHDRSAMEQEYHGLRDYRPGDTLRWIHWRTTARVGAPMVREFEQQSEQDLAILIDSWLPRSKVTSELRNTLEAAIRFAATLCLETCRRSNRRLVVGWTGQPAGLCQGFASVKLLHEVLTQLAVLHASSEGSLAGLLDSLPAPLLRDGQLVIISTRALNLHEEVEKTERLGGAASRGLLSRSVLLDVGRGDLSNLFDPNADVPDLRPPAPTSPLVALSAASPTPPRGSHDDEL